MITKTKLCRSQSYRGSYASLVSSLKLISLSKFAKSFPTIEHDKRLLNNRVLNFKQNGQVESASKILKSLKILFPHEDLTQFIDNQFIHTVKKHLQIYKEAAKWEDYTFLIANLVIATAKDTTKLLLG